MINDTSQINSDDMPSTSEQCRKNFQRNFKLKKEEKKTSKYLAKRRRTILEHALKTMNNTRRRNKKIGKRKDRKKRPTKINLQISTNRLLKDDKISSHQENRLINYSNPKKNVEEDDDDCIFIEPVIEEITVDDENASNVELKSEYENLLISLKEKSTSTPLSKGTRVPTQPFELSKNITLDDSLENEAVPFFEDVASSLNFIPPIYETLGTLMEQSKNEQKCLNDSTLKLNNNGMEKSAITIHDDSTFKDDESELWTRDRRLSEDSVIFVSETNGNDFLPLTSKDSLNIIKEDMEKTPKRISVPNLFTRSEKKELNKYNTNTYNPSGGITDKQLSQKRMVIIDGSNVAYAHALCKNFSVRGLKIAIEYFEKMGHEVKAIVPQFRICKNKSTEPDELERLHRAGKIVFTPCKNLPGKASSSYDDRFILQLACELDGVIISNDNYRDLIFENSAFKKIIENRVIGYTWCNDIFILPKDPYGKWGPTLSTILNRVEV